MGLWDVNRSPVAPEGVLPRQGLGSDVGVEVRCLGRCPCIEVAMSIQQPSPRPAMTACCRCLVWSGLHIIDVWPSSCGARALFSQVPRHGLSRSSITQRHWQEAGMLAVN